MLTSLCASNAAWRSGEVVIRRKVGEMLMAAGDSKAKKLDRAVVDATEAVTLADRVGQTFAAAVVETGDRYGTVVLDDPPVRARCDARHLPLGGIVHVRCVEADPATRVVRFERLS